MQADSQAATALRRTGINSSPGFEGRHAAEQGGRGATGSEQQGWHWAVDRAIS